MFDQAGNGGCREIISAMMPSPLALEQDLGLVLVSIS
jgi:hypothetical protein